MPPFFNWFILFQKSLTVEAVEGLFSKTELIIFLRIWVPFSILYFFCDREEVEE